MDSPRFRNLRLAPERQRDKVKAMDNPETIKKGLISEGFLLPFPDALRQRIIERKLPFWI